MAENDTQDPLELKSTQSRKTRKKTETDTDTGQTLAGAGLDAADSTAAPARKRRASVSTRTAAGTRRTTTSRTRKKAEEEAAPAAQAAPEDGDAHYNLSPSAAAMTEQGSMPPFDVAAADTTFETWVRAAVQEDDQVAVRRAPAQEKPAVRRRRRASNTEDDPGIPSISLADELAAHDHAGTAAAAGNAIAGEQSLPLDDGEDNEPGSFSSFVAQLNGTSSAAGRVSRVSRSPRAGRTAKTSRTSRTAASASAAPAQVTKVRKAARNMPADQPSLTDMLADAAATAQAAEQAAGQTADQVAAHAAEHSAELTAGQTADQTADKGADTAAAQAEPTRTQTLSETTAPVQELIPAQIQDQPADQATTTEQSESQPADTAGSIRMDTMTESADKKPGESQQAFARIIRRPEDDTARAVPTCTSAAQTAVPHPGRLAPQLSAAYAGHETALTATADQAGLQPAAMEAEAAQPREEASSDAQAPAQEPRVLTQLRARSLRAFPAPVSAGKPAGFREPAHADAVYHEVYHEDDSLDIMARRVSLQESKAGMEDDVTPFLAHFQYGDGKVESCIIGTSDQPAVFVPADEGREHNFFRICRHVHVPEGDHATPLPEEGFWIPPHPGPKMLQRELFMHQPPSGESMDTALAAGAARTAGAAGPAADPAAAPAAGESGEESACTATPGHLPRILMCWVGKVDISAALRHDTVNPGPIRMLLEFVPAFDYVLLLTAMNQNVTDTLKSWLAPCIGKGRLEIRKTAVTDLSDHKLINQIATESIEDLIKQYHLPATGEGITFHLSPGSPVTHAILLLLATIRYRGVTLMQTRLTGLGKDPDILTISMDDVLGGHAPALEELRQRMEEQTQAAQAAHAALAGQDGQDAEDVQTAPDGSAAHDAGQSRQAFADAKSSLQPRGRLTSAAAVPGRKAKSEARDLAQRFKSLRKAAPAPQSETVLQPKIQVVQTQVDRPIDYDLPCAVQDENNLRAPVASIGKPGRIAPTALMPREGEPPTISAELGDVYKKMQRVATMYISILLLGESGCGKSRLARYLHEWSGRTGKFVGLDCAGLTDDMFYTELFGRGGPAVARPREGALRRARSGTLFLENVHMLTPTQQGILVRLLSAAGETRVALPAAAPYPACQCRIRVIAAAHPSLMDEVRSGGFRTDLYYRLAGVSTMLPPVREYTFEERENLLRSFLVNLQQKLGQCWNFSGDAWQTLIEEKWPGNLREVSRILQQICLLSDAETTITREDVLLQLQHSRVIDLGEPAVSEPVFDQAHIGGVEGSLLAGSSDDEERAGDAGSADTELEELRHLNDGADNDFFELGSGGSLDDTLSKMRLAKIVEAMDRTNGNRVEAAKLLGLSYVQLNYTLKQLLKGRKNSSEKD